MISYTGRRDCSPSTSTTMLGVASTLDGSNRRSWCWWWPWMKKDDARCAAAGTKPAAAAARGASKSY
jgi:hypothetical protein